MAQPLSDYFALEAGEFLDGLDALLSRTSEAPDAQAFWRAARGVRGSAQIAGVTGIAMVAERLEEAARALKDGRLDWGEEVRQRAIRTVDDLRVLVRGAGRWGEAEEARSREAAARWGEGGRKAAGALAGGDQLFAFVRREITGVVAELDRVAGELAEAPAAREPLRAVLRRMRPVRGVAGMSSLAPVLEVLEGIEDEAQEMVSRALPADEAHLEVLRAAREALDAAGRSLERGEAPGETPELQRFRDARDRTGGDPNPDAAVVPVTSLFFDAPAQPHLVSSTLAPLPAPAGEAVPEEVETFLRIEATGFLDRAEGLLAEAAAGPRARFGRAARQLSELASGVRDLALTYGMGEVAAAAEAAAARLRLSHDADAGRHVLAALRAAIPGVPPASGHAVPSPEGPAAPSPEAGGEADVVPIESLLYDAEGALREALSLRGRVEALLGAAGRRGTPAGEMIDEIFGLVELGLNGRKAS